MIFIRKKIINKIKLEAKKTFPEECCGFLSGIRNKEIYKIDEFHPSENISQTPELGFEINPECQINLQKKLRLSNRKILGIYHSHPNGSVNLSAKDIYFFNDKGLLWFIVALREKKHSKVLVYMRKDCVSKEFLNCEYHIENEKFFK
ncbi:MAG: hypothetical protein CMM49_02365 [Rhodospirillaceae bacterium]|nr:hypothetical protein [Rhodospirillaceae bacterium]|tara:strand:- start:1068 stop:1508 length:441 start_codon:yes stop_codon:yes gene_type:complete